MDFKGITWVGNIYQKFEAVCLEVEEIMYQDTVKYVENQVQTVGAGVKKFYSDVMEDLLPLCAIDPVKVDAADFSPNPYAHVGIYKKPKASMKEDPIRVDKQSTEASKVISGVDAGLSSPFRRLHDVNSFPSQSFRNSSKPCFEFCSGQNDVGGMHDCSNVSIKESLEKGDYPPSKTSRSSTQVSEDCSGVSSCCEISESHEAACDQIIVRSPQASVETRGCNSQEEWKMCNFVVVANVPIPDAATDSPMSDMISFVKSSGEKVTDMRCNSSSGGLSSESISADTYANCGLVSQTCSNSNGDTQYGDSAADQISTSHTGRSRDYNSDIIENYDVIEPGIETIDQFDKSKLEETCVLVDGDKLCLVSHREGKPKSYKKKIRQVFSSKARSTRKQEYKQLAAQYGEIDMGSSQHSAACVMPTLIVDSNSHRLSSREFCESEWEFL